MRAAGAHQRRRRILVVEDESIVRDFLTKALDKLGYEALVAKDGGQASALFRQYASELALILVEVALPSINGMPFIRTLPTLEPRIPVVFTSCLGDAELTEELPGPVLQKPFRTADLRRLVRDNALPIHSASPR